MASYKIAWLPGDGIGREVLEATKIVLEAIHLSADYVQGDIGWEFWRTEGDALPQRTIDLLRESDAAMFGAVTSKPAKQAEAELVPELRGQKRVYRSPIVRMRQVLDLYICQRPCKAYLGNPLNVDDKIDIVVFRENTEDLYAAVEFYPVNPHVSETLSEYSVNFAPYKNLPPDEYAISCKINTRRGCERIARAAFKWALKNDRRKVTVVHKANVVRFTDGMFLETCREVAKEFPEIQVDDANIDAMCMWLLKNPLNYDVLVAPNLYGDIISDLCAQMIGGLGFGCSGNIGEDMAVFEPTHGSAPKYAGLYKVNPIASILAAKMMLEWLGEIPAAEAVEGAVAEVIAEGKVRTYDMGGDAGTLDMARAIAAKL